MDFDEDGSAAEGGMKEDHSTPEWQLYNAVKYHKNVGGQLIAEPFMRLPSKRYTTLFCDILLWNIFIYGILKILIFQKIWMRGQY